MDTLMIRVAGVTYNQRQRHLAKLRGTEPIRIEPEPENPYDKNALAVKCSIDGEVQHLGYIPRELASRLAPLLEGESLMVEIEAVTGGFELEDGSLANLGLVLRVEVPGEDSGAYADDSEVNGEQGVPF